MLFDEFFKKKRIDLDALKKAEPGLFSEFKTHYEQMGEKSFDHTKKYWFNKIRREYPLAVEAKTEKVRLPNPLAEQTITESLDEQIVAPKPGFVPIFTAASDPQSVADQPKENAEETPAATSNAPKPGFTPRFKAVNMPESATGVTPAKPEDSKPENPVPKPAYKPRFNVKNLPKKEEE